MPLLSRDRQLLEAFRRGDRAALGEVYRHYAPLLTRQLFHGLRVQIEGRPMRVEIGGWCDAEVIVQETFTRAFQQRARESYDGLRSYSGFLLGVAKNILLDEWR